MPNKKKSEVNPDAWLNTYADMITLVLTFFVLLFSMSTINGEKFQILMEAFSEEQIDELNQIVIQTLNDQSEANDPEASGGSVDTPTGNQEDEKQEVPTEFDDVFEYIKAQVIEAQMEDQIEVAKGEDYVFIRFKDNIFFDPDKAFLKEGATKILDFLCLGLQNVTDQIKTIEIDGHTADVPEIEDYPVSDRTLSSQRADAVLQYIENKNIIDPGKLFSSGFGKYRPLVSNDTPENRSKNRRVEILITKDGGASKDVLDIYQLLEEPI